MFHQEFSENVFNTLLSFIHIFLFSFVLRTIFSFFMDVPGLFPFSKSIFECRRILHSNEYLIANIGFDTAENEPSKTWRTFRCENAFFVAKMDFMEKMHICHCRFEYPRHVRGFGRGRSGAARTSHRCSIGVGQGDQAFHRKRQKRSLQAARYVNPMITSFAFPCPENSGSYYSFWKNWRNRDVKHDSFDISGKRSMIRHILEHL